MADTAALDLEYKIAQPNTSYLIGSSSIDQAGTYYNIHFDALQLPANKRIKRLLDLSLLAEDAHFRAAAALRASGRRQLPASSDGSCPLLRDGQCSIYDSRPFGCRTHFCQEAGHTLVESHRTPDGHRFVIRKA